MTDMETPEMKLLVKAFALAIEGGLLMGKTPEEIAEQLARDVAKSFKDKT